MKLNTYQDLQYQDLENESDSAGIDRLLEEFLRSELAGQSFLLEPTFRAHVEAMRSRRNKAWAVGAALAAILMVAASLAISNTPQRQAPLPTVASVDPSVPFTVTPPAEQIQTTIYSQTIQGPVVDVIGMPMQVFHRDVVEQTQYYDPATQTTIRETVPRQQVILIGLQEY